MFLTILMSAVYGFDCRCSLRPVTFRFRRVKPLPLRAPSRALHPPGPTPSRAGISIARSSTVALPSLAGSGPISGTNPPALLQLVLENSSLLVLSLPLSTVHCGSTSGPSFSESVIVPSTSTVAPPCLAREVTSALCSSAAEVAVTILPAALHAAGTTTVRKCWSGSRASSHVELGRLALTISV